MNFRTRDERGQSALQVIVGATIITLIVGGFASFWIDSERSSRDTVERTSQESAAVQVLNRVNRDVQNASRVLKAADKELVVERGEPAGTVERRYYRVQGTGDAMVLVTRVQRGLASGAPYNPATGWTADSTLGRYVTPDTRFDYFTRAGATTTNPRQVGRVDTTYTARAADGTVSLKSSAAVRNVAGGGGGGPVATIIGPSATNDAISIMQGQSGSLSVIANDTCNDSASECVVPPNVTVTVSGLPAGVSVTPQPSSNGFLTFNVAASVAPGTYTVPYTLADSTGLPAATANVVLTVVAAPTPVQPNAVADVINVVRGGPAVTLNLYANDTNIDPTATTALGAVPSGLTVTRPNATSGTVTVSAGAAFAQASGFADFTYTVTNPATVTGPGLSSTATVRVRVVDAVEDTVPLSRANGEAGTATFNIRANDVPSSPTVSGGPAVAILTRSHADLGVTYNASTGDVTLTAPTSLPSGAHWFDYRLTQSGGNTPSVSDTARVSVDVTTAANLALTAYAYPVTRPDTLTATQGRNRVEWTATRAPYTVQRATSASGAFTTVATGVTGTTWEENAPLGSTYSYRVIDSQPVTETSDRNIATQFPAQPTATALGSDRNNDGVPEVLGTNRVEWTAVPDAVGYVVAELNSSDGAVVTLVSASRSGNLAGTVTGWNHTARPRGAEATYRVAAYTACDEDIARSPVAPSRTLNGVDQCGSAAAQGALPTSWSTAPRAYQAPSTTPQEVTIGAPDADACFTDGVRNVSAAPAGGTANGYYHCASNSATLSFTTVPDHGDVDPFCSFDAGLCSGRYDRQAGAAPTQAQVAAGTQTRYGAVVDYPQASAAGATDQYAIAACNPGGCSGLVGTTARAYPGVFAVDSFEMPSDERGVYTTKYVGGNWAGSDADHRNARMRFSWSASAGAQDYSIDAVGTAGHRVGHSAASNTVRGTATDSGLVTVEDATTYTMVARANVERTAAAPAARWRDSRASGRTAPPPPTFLQDSPFCNLSAPDPQGLWKYGISYRHQAHDSAGSSAVTNHITGTRVMNWASRVNVGDGDDVVGIKASQNWMSPTNEPSTTNWPAPGTWTTATRVWSYSQSANPTWGENMMTSLTGGYINNRYIPANTGTVQNVGHVRMETYTTRADAGNPQFGDLTSWNVADGNDFRSASGMRARATGVVNNCNATVNTNQIEKYRPNFITAGTGTAVTRRAHRALGAPAGNVSPHPSITPFRRWNNINGFAETG